MMAQKVPLWITTSIIAVLGVVAIVLSYFAFTGVASGENEGLPVKPGAPTELITEAEFPASEPESAPAPELPVETINLLNSSRMLATVDDLVVRANTGTCESPGIVEFSEDSGQSWRASQSLAEIGATQILRILPTERFLVQAVALDQNCEPQLYRTEDLGATWIGPLVVEGTWYFSPINSGFIGAPDGLQPSPCEVVSLAATGDRAAALCADSSIKMTNDRAVSWSNSAVEAGALAINYSQDSYVVAQAGDNTCAGVRLVALGAGEPLPMGCFQVDLDSAAFNSGSIALTQSGDLILLWVEDNFTTSTDMGTTWL